MISEEDFNRICPIDRIEEIAEIMYGGFREQAKNTRNPTIKQTALAVWKQGLQCTRDLLFELIDKGVSFTDIKTVIFAIYNNRMHTN